MKGSGSGGGVAGPLCATSLLVAGGESRASVGFVRCFGGGGQFFVWIHDGHLFDEEYPFDEEGPFGEGSASVRGPAAVACLVGQWREGLLLSRLGAEALEAGYASLVRPG